MKNSLFIVISLFISGNLIVKEVYGQGFFIDLKGGYSLPMSSQNLESLDFYNFNATANSIELEQINMSFGKGVNLDVSIGYMINEFIGFETGFSFLESDRTLASQTNYITISSNNITHELYVFSDQDIGSRMFHLYPSVVLNISVGLVKPYAKFGFMLAKGNIDMKEDSYAIPVGDRNVVATSSVKFLMQNGWGTGLLACMGVKYNLSQKIAVLGELRMVNMSCAPEKGTFKEYKIDAYDQLPFLNIYGKETVYLDRFTYHKDDPMMQTQPRKELKTRMPFGSIGLNFGISFGL
jgi:opacity protein-like surface antigen